MIQLRKRIAEQIRNPQISMSLQLYWKPPSVVKHISGVVFTSLRAHEV